MQDPKDQIYHIPVLLEACLDGLITNPNGCYVDLTFGGGGHSKGILSRLNDGGMLFGVDQDQDAQSNIIQSQQFIFLAGNFRYIERFMDYFDKMGAVDGVLADLGVSSHHFDNQDRGFSFRSETPLLDMRMNKNSKYTARDILCTYNEEELADILYNYGELRASRRIASEIVKQRTSTSLSTIGDLIRIVDPLLNPKDRKRQLSQLFQALRIEVNQELSALSDMLLSVEKILRPGGRFAVITYHSLEDRIVKQFFKRTNEENLEQQIYGGQKSNWQLVTRKPIVPSPLEIQQNPRSRSAKLRIASWLPHTTNVISKYP